MSSRHHKITVKEKISLVTRFKALRAGTVSGTSVLNENYMKGPHASLITASQIRHLVTCRLTDSVCTNFSSA